MLGSKYSRVIIVGVAILILFLILVPILPPRPDQLYIGNPRCVEELEREGITCYWVRYSVTYVLFGFGSMTTYSYGWVRYYFCVPKSGQTVPSCVIFDLNH